MLIIPAIDLYDNKCVRLHKGQYAEMKIYHENPVEQAIEFELQGATHLHLVDLEAAQKGTLRHIEILREIKKATSLYIDFGGGIRSLKDAKTLIDAGAEKINIGTLAVKRPILFIKIIQHIGIENIILSADRDGKRLKISGWEEDAAISFNSFIDQYKSLGGKYITSTDIRKDGTLSGVNFNGYQKLWKDHPSCKIIVSGGVSNYEDVLQFIDTPIYGVIIGKAIYENKIDLNKLIHQLKAKRYDY